MANRPVHEIRLGKGKAAIGENETEAGVRYSVSIVRIVKTEEGWDSSPTFGRDELPLVAKVADMVHTWLFQQNDRIESSPEEPEATQQPSGGRRQKTGNRG